MSYLRFTLGRSVDTANAPPGWTPFWGSCLVREGVFLRASGVLLVPRGPDARAVAASVASLLTAHTGVHHTVSLLV